MGMNNSKKAIMYARIAHVASLRLKGYTQREIILGLENLHRKGDSKGNKISYGVNPKTNARWSVGIINKDLAKLEKEWKTSALRDIIDHKSKQLAEINQVKKKGWETNNMKIVLRALNQEADILGTKATIKHKIENDPNDDSLIIKPGTDPIEAARTYQKFIKGG